MTQTMFFQMAEVGKSTARECFAVQQWMVDGLCASILHLTQSGKLRGYMAQRRKRLDCSRQQDARGCQEITPASAKAIQKDPFLYLYLN